MTNDSTPAVPASSEKCAYCGQPIHLGISGNTQAWFHKNGEAWCAGSKPGSAKNAAPAASEAPADHLDLKGFHNLPESFYQPALPYEKCMTCGLPRIPNHGPTTGEIRYVLCNLVSAGEFHPYRASFRRAYYYV